MLNPMYAKVREHGAPRPGGQGLGVSESLSHNQRMTFTSAWVAKPVSFAHVLCKAFSKLRSREGLSAANLDSSF